MNIFYQPDIFETNLLSEEESSHCVRVLRMKKGDEIRIINGKGDFHKAEITDANPKTAPNIPCHFPRSLGANKSPITAKALAKIAPPPNP